MIVLPLSHVDFQRRMVCFPSGSVAELRKFSSTHLSEIGNSLFEFETGCILHRLAFYAW